METFHKFCNVINIFHLTVPSDVCFNCLVKFVMCFILTKTYFPSPTKHCYFTSDFFITPSYLYTQFISPHEMQRIWDSNASY